MTTLQDLDTCRRLLRELEQEQAAEAGGPGARRFERFPVRGDIRLRSDRPEVSIPPIFGILRDLGRGGAGVLVSQPVGADAAWHLELRTNDAVAAILPAFCRHCRKLTDDAYLVGMAFGAESALLMAFGIGADAICGGDRSEVPPGDFLAGG